jgi:hypothetical protein
MLDRRAVKARRLTMHTFSQDTKATDPRRLAVPKLPERIRPGNAQMPAYGVVHDFGNIAIHPMARGLIQTKLAVGQPGDKYEQQADEISARVMQMADASPVRGNGAGSERTKDQSPKRVSTKPVETGQSGQIAAPPAVNGVLASAGQPMDTTTRGFMEPRFGHDFSQVRIHDDTTAAGSADAMAARAYTVGHHVVFGSGEYRPGTADGRRLLAHELVHVTQQNTAGTGQDGLLQRDAKKPDPKVLTLKAELVATYELSGVTDTTGVAEWTAPELEKMKRALARIPAAERGAIKGVELRRVATTTEFGNVASGLFKQMMDQKTGLRQDRIEIANDAFNSDKDYDAGGANTNFGGQRVQGAPSEGVLAHEVGHAVEALPQRQAEAARIRSSNTSDAAFGELQKARTAYNNAVLSGVSVPGWSNPREKAYMDAIIGAQKKLAATLDVTNTFPDKPSAAESAKAATDFKNALPAARAAIAARKKASAALPANSSYALTADENAQDAWMAAAEALVAPLEARAATQKDSEQATGVEDATKMTITVSSGKKVKMTRVLAEFVAIVEVNKIDIAGAGLGGHVTSNWPDNPAEAYAELYSLSVTAPDGLKKFDKTSAIASYFTSPVGLKGSQQASARSWLASHQ